MIELKDDRLVFSFPEVHPSARVTIEFQRTLRIPDDDKDYPLPPGLGAFPLFHVDDYASNVPEPWQKRGGVMMPMYQAEAMWINFTPFTDPDREVEYPFAVKIATGKVNAVSGSDWKKGLHRKPEQDYVVIPEQPWLDGYCVENGIIRQFVAMPLGSGYSAEEQITGKAEYGGLQIQVYPMKRKVFEKRFPKRTYDTNSYDSMILREPVCCCYGPDMGLAPGGRMRQNIERDPFGINDWDRSNTSRCYVHIANSMVWQGITHTDPPHPPPTSKSYTDAGLPWFEWYSDRSAPLKGSKTLSTLKSVAKLGQKKNEAPLHENESVTPDNIIALRSQHIKRNQVREY
jgi:hypothetical protein